MKPLGKSKKSGSKRGQISILIVFSLIPLVTLFAFVVNIGMLVNAKISLQNAADLAAYAGAATQARQLTHISHINYQMRQAYKKFLFKLYVIGNLSLKCFPRDGSQPDPACAGTGNPDQDFSWINPPPSYCGNPPPFPGVPSVCIALSKDSNPCQLGCAVPKVIPPKCFPLDPTCGVLANAAAAIADIQGKSCAANTLINQELVAHWLYSTDFESDLNTQPALSGLIQDIGLVVEGIMNKSRIDTIAKYINVPGFKELNQARVQSQLQNLPDQAKGERSFLAFATAFNNLNGNVFIQDSVTMDELIPDSPMLELEEVKPRFEVPYASMDGSNPDKCEVSLGLFSAAPILGVFKKPTSHVYYAIKLTAKARILFNPFPFNNPDEGIELTAYSAAQPFGSRIGPEFSTEQEINDNFTKTGNIIRQAGQPPVPIRYPFLRMGINGQAFDKVGVLKDFHKILQGDAGATSISRTAFDRGIQAAQMPDQLEIGKYNIPVDSEATGRDGASHSMVPYYVSANAISEPKDYTFWAPILPVGDGDSLSALKDRFKAEIEQNISQSQTGSTSNDPQAQANVAISAVFLNRIDKLFTTSLRQRNNFNVARMVDPLGTAFFQKFQPRPSVSGKELDPRKLATSYTTDRDLEYFLAGRDGYSVKFIPFKMLLTSPGKVSNLKGTALWPVVTDPLKGERAELLKVAH